MKESIKLQGWGTILPSEQVRSMASLSIPAWHEDVDGRTQP